MPPGASGLSSFKTTLYLLPLNHAILRHPTEAVSSEIIIPIAASGFVCIFQSSENYLK